MLHPDLIDLAADAEPPKIGEAEQVEKAENEKKEVDDENENDDDEKDDNEGNARILLLLRFVPLESPHKNDMGARMVPRLAHTSVS